MENYSSLQKSGEIELKLHIALSYPMEWGQTSLWNTRKFKIWSLVGLHISLCFPSGGGDGEREREGKGELGGRVKCSKEEEERDLNGISSKNKSEQRKIIKNN